MASRSASCSDDDATAGNPCGADLNAIRRCARHATILHQLGIDHTRLTFRSGGRDHRLTDVHGRVLSELLA